MDRYTVTGMTCAACQARVEKAVAHVEGVDSVAVNLLTNSMNVEGSASKEAVIAAIVDAGYGASAQSDRAAPAAGASAVTAAQEDALIDRETPVLKRRLIWSIGFLAVLLYFSMGHMMLDWPLPGFFTDNHIAMGLFQMLLTIIIMVINQRFFINGFKTLFKLSPNMDSLVALGSAAAFGYSTYALFAMTAAAKAGNTTAVTGLMHEFYFETAATILTLITVGKMLEARSKGKTTNALKSLMKLAPQTATVIRDGRETTVSIESVVVGDEFVVRPGESVPVDGVIISGTSALDESTLTGESIPVDKQPGDELSAATINQSGFLTARALRVGKDTALAQIIQMVSDAAASKAPIAKIADRVSAVFVPVVIGIALITMAGWLIAGAQLGNAIARGIAVLVISCPCALGLATPVAIMVGNGKAARNGILFKNASAIEETGKVNIVALDKTGTITSGKPVVTDVVPFGSAAHDELLAVAYALESKSEHPLAHAILEYGAAHNTPKHETTDFEALAGNGLTAQLDGVEVFGGNLDLVSRKTTVEQDVLTKAQELSLQGKTPIYFGRAGQLLGIIALADTVRDDSVAAIKELRDMGLEVVMITGDNEKTAHAIAQSVGITSVVAGVKPDGKDAAIQELQQRGKVAMVGDGINDAPALTRAEVGIAIGAGTDVAISAADVVLMKNSLYDVAAAIRLSKGTLRNIHENLFWAFIYNIIGIPLATGVLYPLLGWQLNPIFGAAAMSLSSFSVVSNALRLNLLKVYPNLKPAPQNSPAPTQQTDEATDDTPPTNPSQKENTMQKTLTITGMMCGHCEARVKKALEALDGVESAEASHEAGTAVVTLSAPVADEDLKAAVEAQDYSVTSIA